MSDDAASLMIVAALFIGWPLCSIANALRALLKLAERSRP